MSTLTVPVRSNSARVEPVCGDNLVYAPFFSPDGKWLGWSCKGLYKVPLSGGLPILLTENASFAKGATWSSRGIVYAPAAKSGLVLVREEGGPLESLTVPDSSQGEVSHRWPSALPDGRHVLFTIKKEGITSFDLEPASISTCGTPPTASIFRSSRSEKPHRA